MIMTRKLPIILLTAFSLVFALAVHAMRSDNPHPHSPKHNVAMKKIFLCSSFHDVASLLPKFFSVPLKGKTVAFIPTASIHEEYTQYVEDGKTALDSLGLLIKDLEITQHDTKEIAQCLEECDYIYVSGGNTFFLIQELRRTGADKLIVEQVENGKPYIGESAGAMVISPNTEYAQKIDDPPSQMPDFKGLNIVKFYPVPHFGSFPFEEETQLLVREYIHLPLKPITNQQAIVVIGDSVTIWQK